MTIKNIQLYFFLGLLGLICFFNLIIFLPFMKLFAVVAIFAVVFYPMFEKFKKNIINNDNFSAALTIVVVGVIVLIPVTFFTFKVFGETKVLYSNIGNFNTTLSEVSASLNTKLAGFVPAGSIDLSAYLTSVFHNIVNNLGNIFSSILSFIPTIFLGVIALFFFLRDGKRFLAKLIAISPLEDVYDEQILNKLKRTINSIVRGTLVIALIQGLLAWTGFIMFGIPHSALWGGLTVFAALIPGVGTALVVVPAIVYLIFSSSLFNVIGLIVWGILIIGLVDNFLRPYLVGKEVNVHPFIVMMSVFGGLIVFGPLGFLLGPLVLSLFSALLDIYPTVTKKVLK
jgi:predicted PurR-regulated permease PerM